jgi:hypothetical protein
MIPGIRRFKTGLVKNNALICFQYPDQKMNANPNPGIVTRLRALKFLINFNFPVVDLA